MTNGMTGPPPIKLGDVVMKRGDSRARHVPPTTAHVAAARFYKKAFRQNQTRPSLLQRAAAIPSPVSVEEFLKEIAALPLKRKLREQLEETCRLRLATLRGVVA